ncbi:MAG: hypothetical protein GTN81_00100 [Proteobacteria bacterium]|nr:hypothetical protein [Pseudomonadota bacterium]
MAGCIRILVLVSVILISILAIPFLGLDKGGAQEVLVMVPFCETYDKWTGRYETLGTETVRVPFTDYREEPVPGTGRWGTEKKRVPPYTAYRFKLRWVDKVITVVRTIMKPVTTWVRKVKTWFERTWLGKLVKKVSSWFEPVKKWVKQNIRDRITKRVRETFMEPYPVYNYENLPVWIPLRTRRVAFTNHYEVEKPIREKITEPVDTMVNRWTHVEARGIPQWVVQEMFHRLPPCEPLEERLDEIYATWDRFRDGLTAYHHASIDSSYRDEFKIFLDDLPGESGYSMARFPMLPNGFGGGRRPWSDYTADGADAAQYFRLEELAGEWGWENPGLYPDKHVNLCGELAVIGAVGDTIPEGLGVFSEVDGGAVILQTNDTSYWYHLRDFFIEYGWEASYDAGQTTPENLADELSLGRAVVALVDLNSTSGLLQSGGGTPHWVTVLQVLGTNGNGSAVRVYNSFENREEYYTWGRFYDSWKKTTGNSSVSLRVLAWRRPKQPEPRIPE